MKLIPFIINYLGQNCSPAVSNHVQEFRTATGHKGLMEFVTNAIESSKKYGYDGGLSAKGAGRAQGP